MFKILLVLTICSICSSSDNGLGLRPPMGWLSWLRYMCTVDCKTYPTSCISEVLIKQMADRMAIGFKDVGYQYVMIDDCWLANNRAQDGSLLPDPDRFPSGIKALSDYIHSKGLKFGIYEDVGTKTCAGFPGSLYHLEQDAKTFASWDVDYVKFDGCNVDADSQPSLVAAFSNYLNRTGRQIFLNVEWPIYMGLQKVTPELLQILVTTTNMARVCGDISGNWESIRGVIDSYRGNGNNFTTWARPGYLNDPDMLMIGNNYVTPDQEKLQMTMWSMFAAPLIMSNDLRNISAQSVAILTNKNIIAINQDPLLTRATCTKAINNVQIWSRQLSGNRKAVALVNLESSYLPLNFTLADAGETEEGSYLVTEVYDGRISFKTTRTAPILMSIRPTSGEIYTYTKQ